MNIRSKNIDNLFTAILSLENIEECYAFFEDVCTIKELQGLAQRLEVARLLSEGNIFSSVSEKTGASSATISRVNKCLQYGSGGYRTVLERTKDSEEKK